MAERLFTTAMAAMDVAANKNHTGDSDGSDAGPVREDTLAQQHELIRQADEYADLFTHAAMMASAAVSRAMDADQVGQGGQS